MQGLAARLVAAFALAFATACGAAAQTAPANYPARPVKLVLPFGAGSGSDIAARLIGEKLQARWGKSVIVENRPGGDGLLAVRAFVSAADDHTLLYSSTASFILHPYTLPTKPPYDLEADLLPIARTTDSALTIAASAGSGAKTLGEWVALARANPGKFNAAGGAGVAEMSVRAFIKEQKLPVTFVPYRDIVQAGGDLAEDRLQLLSSSLAVAQPHVDAGKARFVAVATSARSPVAPDIPSAAEQGFPTIGYESTVGFYGPAGMSLALRERIAADIMEVLKDQGVVKRLADTGQAVVAEGPAQLQAVVKRQQVDMSRLAAILDMPKKE